MKPRQWLLITALIACAYVTAEILAMFGAPAMPSRLAYLILAAILVGLVAAGSFLLAGRARDQLAEELVRQIEAHQVHIGTLMVEAAAYANRRHEGLVERIEGMGAEYGRTMTDLAAVNAQRLDEIEADHGRQFGELAKLLIEHSVQHERATVEDLPEYDRGYADGLARSPMRAPLRSVDG